MDRNDRHPSEQSEKEGVRIVRREDVEIDIREESEERTEHRSPWPTAPKASGDTSSLGEPAARLPLSTDWSTDRMTDRPTDQTKDRSTERPIDRPIDRPTRLTQQSAGRRAELSGDRATEQAKPTPFLRPLRTIADDHEFDEIDLRDPDDRRDVGERKVSQRASDRVRDRASSDASQGEQTSRDKIPPVLAHFEESPTEKLTEQSEAFNTRSDQEVGLPLGSAADTTKRQTAISDVAGTSDAKTNNGQRRSWRKKSATRQSASAENAMDDSADIPTAEQFQKSSLATRIMTGLVAAVLALIAFANGPVWLMALSVAILVGAAMEFFDGVRAAGFRPATALGIAAVVGLIVGAYARGEAAIPIVLSLAIIFTFLWFISGVVKASPTANIAVTLLGVAWIGVFGSFAALLLRAPDRRGVALLAGAVLVVVAYDTAAYLGGSFFGRRKLAPAVSPSKTVEGAFIGTAAAFLVGLIGLPFIHPWGILSGAFFAIAVAIVAPIGDLAESVVKRDIGVKDMGRILPGHGGILDRFDAFLMVLPVTYFVALALNLL